MARPVSLQTRALLCVMQWPGVGAKRARDLARLAGMGGDVLAVARHALAGSAARAEQDMVAINSSVQGILDSCERLDVNVLSLVDAEYPDRLREVADAPPVIYARGSTSALSLPAVAVVGTRKASDAGGRAARAISTCLVGEGLSVVSGLALGIDTHAHLGALDAHGCTIAVLAHGLDTISPASNRSLAARIVAEGGALVSEHPPGVPPRPAEFARRNRIQSGLSACSVVVESGDTGGTMIQAEFAREQGRPLFAVLSEQPGFNRSGAERLRRDFAASVVNGTGSLRRRLREIGVLSTQADEGSSGGFEA